LPVVFRVADPGHPVAAGADDQLANIVQQLDFIVVADQCQIAFADQAQRPVESFLLGLRLLAFGDVGVNADHAQGRCAVSHLTISPTASIHIQSPFLLCRRYSMARGPPSSRQRELLLEGIDIVGVNVRQPVVQIGLEILAVVAEHPG
jgi:hypothetical protein